MTPIILGSAARDTITGFRGIVVARTLNLYGPPKILIQPQEFSEAGPAEPYWFTENRCEPVETTIPARREQEED